MEQTTLCVLKHTLDNTTPDRDARPTRPQPAEDRFWERVQKWDTRTRSRFSLAYGDTRGFETS